MYWQCLSSSLQIIHVHSEQPRDSSHLHSASDTHSALVSTRSTSISLSSFTVAQKNNERLSPPVVPSPGNVFFTDPGSSSAPLVSQHEHIHTRAVSLASTSSISLPLTAPRSTSVLDLNSAVNNSDAVSRKIHQSPSTNSMASLIVVTTPYPN